MSKAPFNMDNKVTKFILISVNFYLIAKSTNFDRNNNVLRSVIEHKETRQYVSLAIVLNLKQKKKQK